MELQTVIDILKAEEARLRAQGVEALSVFGSVARGEARDDSDVDLLARINRRPFGLLELAALEIELGRILGAKVDVLTEPIRRDRLRQRIERDRASIF
jgi:uncharacterized protein